jgi:hypothetical protein
MKALVLGTCLAVASVTAGVNLPAGFKAPGSSELARLRALDSGSLADLRGGRVETTRPLSASDRARVQCQQTQFPELAELRAGDTNSTLITILIVVAIVAIVLIII